MSTVILNETELKAILRQATGDAWANFPREKQRKALLGAHAVVAAMIALGYVVIPPKGTL
jgi:hypothetical protein